MTFTIPRRQGADTYSSSTYNGREVYKATGRPVDETFGSHVVLWIVTNAEAWAKAVEAEGDAQLDRWEKKRRYIGEQRRAERYQSADRIRARGNYRSVRSVEWDRARAEAHVAGLKRSHPNPGVRYEVAEITEMRHCPLCHRPAFRADGQWRHHGGGYPIDCAIRLPKLPERKPELGEWVVSTAGWMVCGYCGETESWSQALLGYWTLTGVHAIGLHEGDTVPGVPTKPGDLVVLAEATNLTGGTVMLPHLCEKIPAELYDKYRQDIEDVLANT